MLFLSSPSPKQNTSTASPSPTPRSRAPEFAFGQFPFMSHSLLRIFHRSALGVDRISLTPRPLLAFWVSAGALLLALLAGCAVGPNFKRPAINSPDTFRAATPIPASTNSLGDLP